MSVYEKSAPLNCLGAKAQNELLEHDPDSQTNNPLRNLSDEAFAELGVGQVVFMRSISARELKEFVPEAKSMPGDVQFQMIMGANGAPVLITDSQNAVSDWFAQNSPQVLPRH